MNKMNYLKTGLLSASLLLAGCTGEGVPDSGNNNGSVALQLSAGISVQTRAHDKQWEADDQIGIYMFVAGTEDVVKNAVNIPYKTETGAGTFTPVVGDIFFPMNGSNVDFRAWYPYKAVAEQWSAGLTNQASQSALDLMTATAKSSTAGTVYNKEHPAVQLNFTHRLTKLLLNILPGAGVTATELAGMQVAITRQWSTVLYNPGFNALGFTEELVTIPLLTAGDGTSAQAILFPDNLTGKALTTGRQLVFTLSGSSEALRWNIPDTKSFNAGDKNLYTITVNRSGLGVTSDITDWNQGNGTEGESGNAE